MSDEHKKKDRATTPFEAELRDKADKAWDTAIKALLDYSRANGDLMHYQGWVLGRKNEREAMQEAIAKAAKEGAAGAEPPPAAPATGLLRKIAALHQPGFSANQVVLDAVKANPGLRGVRLLAKIRETHPSMHERTFRTSLHRLKLAKEIYSQDYEWYHKDTRPPSIFDIVEAEDDGPNGPKENGGQ